MCWLMILMLILMFEQPPGPEGSRQQDVWRDLVEGVSEPKESKMG